MRRWLRNAVFVCLVLVAPGELAAELPADKAALIFDRYWFAFSTTAQGVTGDAWLTPTSITFDDRVTFKLRYLSEVTTAKPRLGWDDMREFSLFEIVDPQPQEILHGNHLCGSPRFNSSVPLPRYLAAGLRRKGDHDVLLLLVFTTETPPDISQDEGYCGNFRYTADPPDPNDPMPERRRRVSLSLSRS